MIFQNKIKSRAHFKLPASSSIFCFLHLRSHVESIPFVLKVFFCRFLILVFAMFKRFLLPSFRLIQFRNSSSLLSVSEADGVRNITMVDGKTRNCLSMSMMENLIQEIKQNENDKSLRVIVLSSSGPVFSAGHNLKELAPEKGYESHKYVFDKCHELITSIVTSPLPVISKIDGLAAGKLKTLTLRDKKLIENIFSCWFTASRFL